MENETQNTGGVPNVDSRSNAVSTSFDVQTSQPTQAYNAPVVGQFSPDLSNSQTPPISAPAAPPVAQTRPPRAAQRGWLNRRIIVLTAILVVLTGGSALLWRIFNPPGGSVSSENSAHNAGQFGLLNIPLGDLAQNGQLTLDSSRSLNINGQLKVNSGFVLAPSDKPTSGVAGQMYYDRGTNELNYYNGSGFVSLTNNPQTVTSINGNSGSFTLGGGLGLNGSQLSNSGVISVTSASTNLTVGNDGNGNITLSTTGSGVNSQNGTTGRIAVFTGSSTIADSLLSQSGSAVNVDGDISIVGAASINGGATIGGTLNLDQTGTQAINITNTPSGVTGQIYNDGNLHVTGGTNNLWLDAGGTGTIFLNAGNTNPVAINESTIPAYPLEVNGDVNLTAGHSYRIGGTIICSISGCTGGGGGGVSSLNGQTGVLTVANATGSGSVITINDASTSQKGIAQFNSTNFTVTGGAVNTIQNIDPTANPTFVGINTSTITPNGTPLTVGSNSQDLTLQGTNVLMSRISGGNSTALTFAAPTANVTYRLQTAAAGTYDVCTTVGNCVGVGGTVSTTGGTTNRLTKFTGSQTLGDSLVSDNGTLVTVAGDLSVTGNVTFTNPLPVTSGGTGDVSPAAARLNLGAASSGANSDITSITGLTTALSVTQGGTGATALTANGVLLGNGVGAISSLAAGSANLCLVSTAGAPVWQSCPGGGGVTTVNGLSGAVTIANASAAGSTVTLNDATTSQKGIASFNSSNFTVTSGAVNTIQDIGVAATPTFGRLSLSSSQAASPMLLVNNTNSSGTGNLIDLQLNSSSKFSVNPAGNMTLSGTVNGQTISSAASFTGSVAIATTLNVNTITPTGALTVGSTGQTLTMQGTTINLTSTNGANTAGLTFVAPTANVTYRLQTAAAGTYDVCTTAGNCTGVGGGVTTTGGTTNHLAKFTGSQAVGDSIITDDGSTVTIGGALSTNTITPTGALSIGSTSQNITLLGAVTTLSSTNGGITNSLTFATPTASNKTITIPDASGTVAVGVSGPLSMDTAGNISCPSCVTSGGGGGGQSAVDSLNGLTGALTLNNASGVGTSITINNASTSQKGIAQFNSTNFTASSGVVNTVQDINTTAAPTFGRLLVTSSQATNDMLVVNNTNTGATGSLLKLQLNGGDKFTVDGSGNVVAAGTITSGNINGQTISSSANFTGSVAIASTLNVNTITPTGALTIGAISQNLTLQGSATSLSATNSGNTTTLNFQTPTANVTYRLLTAAAGTYDICTTAGNCTGVGGGVTTPGGTTNSIAKFTGSQTLGNSNISDNGSTVAIAVNLNVNTITPTGAMTIGATAQNLTLQGATVNLSATSSGITNSLTFATPSGSNKTITVPNASGTVAVSASGALSLDASGNLTCPSCVTGSAVSSLNSQTGAVTLANAVGSGGVVTINDASTSQKGIAQFNSTNFSASGGTVNTIQDINTTAAPTFGRLTVTSNQGSSDMFVVNNTNISTTGSLLRLQLNGGDKFTVDSAGNVVAAGTITSGNINGQTISSAASFTGSVAIATTLNVNTITPTGALTVGATNQNITLQGATTRLSATATGITNTLTFATPTGSNKTITIPDASGTVCLDTGNCLGGSGGANTALSNLGSVAINTSLLPGAAGAIDLGSGTLPFGNIYLSGTSATPATNNFKITGASTSGTRTITLPDASGTVCLQSSASCGFAASSGSTNYIQNQSASDQAASFRISGTARANTSVQTPTVDTATAAALAIGNANATSIALGNSSSSILTTVYGQMLMNVVTNSTTSLNIKNATNNNVFTVDSQNGRVGINLSSTNLPAYTLDAAGDINTTTAYRIGGTSVCDTTGSTGCIAKSGSGFYIHNQTTLQSANMNIQASDTTAPTAVFEQGASGTADILDILKNDASTKYLSVSSAGNLAVANGSTYSLNSTTSGSIVSSGAITITAGAASTWSTSSGDLTLQAAGTSNINLQTAGAGTVNVGNVNTTNINIGAGSNIARTIHIGDAGTSTAQIITLGSTGDSSITTIQGGGTSTAINLTTGSGGNINLTASKIVVKPLSDSTTAFQVQNNGSTPIVDVDTVNQRVGINSASPASLLQATQSNLTPGTVSNSASSANVTGSSTTFLSSFQPGDTFTITSSTNTCTVKQITSNTALVCTANLASSSSGSAYSFTQQNRLAVNDDGHTDVGGVLYVKNPGVSDEYSFRVDPSDGTFKLTANSVGNTSSTTTGSDTGNNNVISSSKYNSGTGGTLNALRVFFTSVQASPSNHVKVAVYSDSSGAPGTLLSSATAPSTVAVANTWTTVSLGTTVTLAPNTNYWFAFNVDGASTTYRSSSPVGSASAYVNMTYGSNFPTNFSPSSGDTVAYAIYGAYTSVTDRSAGKSAMTINANNEVTFAPLADSTTAFNVYSALGTETMVVDTINNYVGVNRINIGSNDDANYNFNMLSSKGAKIYRLTSTATDNLLELYSDVGSSGNLKFKVQANGNIFTDGSTTIGTPADMAENYPTAEPVEAGDVVVFKDGMKLGKTTTPYDSRLAGVVSSSPGIILSGNTSGEPLALKGRVPVKISDENGAISAGDTLTASATKPGYAMKATGAGMVIGTALEDFSGGTGTIQMFLNLGYNNPSQNIQGTTQFQNVQVQGQLTAADINVTGTATIKNLNVTGTATINNLHVTNLTTADLTVNGHIITGGGQPNITAGADACGAATTVSGTDTAGLITVTTPAGCNSAGDIADVTFSQAFAKAPRVTLTPANADAAALKTYVDSGAITPTSFTLATPTSVNGSTTYKWYYQVLQ